MQELLAAGADAEPCNSSGVTPLMSASFFGHQSVVSALLAKGADACAHDGQLKRSSLHWAAMNDHLEVGATLPPGQQLQISWRVFLGSQMQ